MSETSKRLSRRDLFKVAAAGAGGVALASFDVSQASQPQRIVAQEPVTIVFHTRTDRDNDYAVMAQETFHEAYPDIRVEIDATPHADFNTKLATLAAGGELGDSWFNFVAGVYYTFAAAGVAEDLTPWVDGDPDVNLDDYFEAAINQCKWDESLAGMPTGGHAGWSSMWTNVDAFNAAGAALPEWEWTYENEWLDSVTAATTEGRFGYQFDFSAQNAYLFIRSWGGDWVNPEDRTQSGINTEETRAALRFMRDLIYEHGVSPRADQVVEQMLANELTNSHSTGIWNRATMVSVVGDKFAWAGLPMPAGPAGRGTFIGVDPVSMNSQSQNKEAVWEWIKWMTNEDAALIGAAVSSPPSMLKSAWEEIEQFNEPEYQYMAQWLNEASGWTLPQNARIGEFVGAINQNVQALMLPNADFDSGIEMLHLAVQDVLFRPSF
jgi:multiple sugar transport system substrate-binding protein